LNTSSIWDLVINVTGLLGIILLAIPLWYANKYGRYLAKLESSTPANYTDKDLQKLQGEIKGKLATAATGWTLWKSAALIIGTILTMLSFGIGVIRAMVV